MQYTNEYYAAKTEAGRVAAHNKAEAFRRSGYKIVSQGTSSNALKNTVKKEVVKNTASSVADTIVGATVIDKLKTTKDSITKIPGLGPAAQVETVTARTGIKALKGVSKYAGPAAIVFTGLDVYDDFNTYSGNDRYYAAGLSIGGSVATLGS